MQDESADKNHRSTGDIASGIREAESPATASKSSKRVLLMDDEEIILEAMARLLEIMGCSVITAKSGEEAIDEFARAKQSGNFFEVVILDLTVRRGLGGIPTVKEIRKLDAEVPVIVSSGYGEDTAMARPKDFGFTASITKPFKGEELSALLSEVASQRRS